MSTGRQQLDAFKLAAQRWAVAGGALVIASTAWAVWPRPGERTDPVQLRTPVAAPSQTKAAGIDIAAFNAPIWNPTPAPKPPAPLAPLRLQLIAITKELAPDGKLRFRAAVYDPDTDGLSQVIAGEKVAGRNVVKVTATELEIADGTGSRRLLLDTVTTGGIP